MRAVSILLLLLSLMFIPSIASAQDEHQSNVFADMTKAVLLDPTTYGPATFSYMSQRMDWKTSQPLFNAGWMEHNQRYTISGRPDDRPLSYGEGLGQIRRDALMHLQESAVNNVTAQLLERTLTQKYPDHRKLLKTLSWVERISFSSYVSYLASAEHFRQVQRNQEMAKAYGITQ